MIALALRLLVLCLSSGSGLAFLQDLIGPSYPEDYSGKLTDGQVFDYIVVGAGAAGIPAAYRLRERGYSVLLVEAGGNPNYLTRVPMASFLLLDSELDYKTQSTPNGVSCLGSKNQQCRISHGKVLGGGTSTNFLMYVRGNQKTFGSWNITGWTYDDILPYFMKFENLTAISQLSQSAQKYHNTSGILKIGKFNDSENVWHDRLVQGLRELKFPLNENVNADSQIGVCNLFGFVDDNERSSTATAYLTQEIVPLVAKNTVATGVIIDDTNMAKGITVSRTIGESISLYARGEVILSAGAINTPQLLMLSGVGSAEHLNDMKINPKVDLPVGENFVDHILALTVVKVNEGPGINFLNLAALAPYGLDLLQYVTLNNGPLSSNGVTDITAFLNTACYDFSNHSLRSSDDTDCEVPDMQFYSFFLERGVVPSAESLLSSITGFDDELIKQIRLANVNNALMVVGAVLLAPKSRGTVKLKSVDPREQPLLNSNFLSEYEDLKKIVSGIKLVQHLTETETFQKYGAELFQPTLSSCADFATGSDEYWECYARQATFLVYHSQGTTGLGRVVDERLRVKNVSRLRVADCGVIPEPHTGNTAAVTIAIGERVADFIMEDNYELLHIESSKVVQEYFIERQLSIIKSLFTL